MLSRDHETAIGTTSLHSWDCTDGSLEMGGTWFGRRWWRTAANTETKLLAMTYAFDTLDFVVMSWRIAVDNKRSQDAIMRIGARLQELKPGGLRRSDGSTRDLLIYTMQRAEWPTAKARLVDRLARG